MVGVEAEKRKQVETGAQLPEIVKGIKKQVTWCSKTSLAHSLLTSGKYGAFEARFCILAVLTDTV